MLFSEPKIPQSFSLLSFPTRFRTFQCSSASRKFLKAVSCAPRCGCKRVSVLFSEPKIPQINRPNRPDASASAVSVLFSEPKIPQRPCGCAGSDTAKSFSALQRAENSSKEKRGADPHGSGSFSALQRAENSSKETFHSSSGSSSSFSALQRAENSSNDGGEKKTPRLLGAFQCSSASRKFLKELSNFLRVALEIRFSALQRAENSSKGEVDPEKDWEPPDVSVLFSEPKIPQRAAGADRRSQDATFQCSSASRKFLKWEPPDWLR